MVVAIDAGLEKLEKFTCVIPLPPCLEDRTVLASGQWGVTQQLSPTTIYRRLISYPRVGLV